MARQIINIGDTANDGTGDRPRTAGQKINSNFQELYASYRERVTSNRTYYVATTGSDSNTGLSPGVAFLTINHAIAVITDTLSIDEGVTITVSVANGTYTIPSTLVLNRITGGGTVLIQGNTGTPGSVILTASAIDQFFYAEGKLVWTVQGFRLQATGGTPIGFFANGGHIKFGAIEFNTGLGVHVKAQNGGFVRAVSNYTIIGSATAHVIANSIAVVDISGLTITLSGTPDFSDCFIDASFIGLVHAFSTYVGSATGNRYNTSENSVIDVQGQNTNFLPGDHPGTSTTGGIYV